MIDAYVRVLAIDPATPTTLYAGTEWLGMFKRTTDDASWSTINDGLNAAHVNALAINPAMPATIYAGTMGGVFNSTNGGENWSEVNMGLADIGVNAGNRPVDTDNNICGNI